MLEPLEHMEEKYDKRYLCNYVLHFLSILPELYALLVLSKQFLSCDIGHIVYDVLDINYHACLYAANPCKNKWWRLRIQCLV